MLYVVPMFSTSGLHTMSFVQLNLFHHHTRYYKVYLLNKDFYACGKHHNFTAQNRSGKPCDAQQGLPSSLPHHKKKQQQPGTDYTFCVPYFHNIICSSLIHG